MEEKSANHRLNNLNKEVREEIDTRLWATMYLNHFVKRIYTPAIVTIELNDLPNISQLSLKGEPLTTTSPEREHKPPFDESPLDLQVEVLKQRLRDAHIGVDAIWATLDNLINTLTSGM